MDTELDLAMLVLRVTLGGMLIAHGANKILGHGGLTGTAAWFESLGLRPGRLHAGLAAYTEIVAGALLLLGLFTSVASAAFVGLMSVAALTDHRGRGYFVFRGGCEYTLLVAVVAVVPTLVGPGRWSLDHGIGLGMFGMGWAGAALAVGMIAAMGLMAVFYRPRPAVS